MKEDEFLLIEGCLLRPIFTHLFSAPMLSFGPPPTVDSPHPGPWVSARGGYGHTAKVQITVSEQAHFPGLPAHMALWLIAVVLRLQVYVPVRLMALGNMSFADMPSFHREAASVRYETSPTYFGVFRAKEHKLSIDDYAWIYRVLPVIAKLIDEERFLRALRLFDQSSWSNDASTAVILVWASLEVLFDLGAERSKTKALCRALSAYVGADDRDRDRAYQIIQRTYESRGRAVHVGYSVSEADLLQSYQFAVIAFRRTLLDERLP